MSIVPPSPPSAPELRLVPLGPEHNASDHAAWMASIPHIRATPGFPMADGWPPPEGLTLTANLADLEQHAREFVDRERFAYTVLAPDRDEVIGCLYIDPTPGGVEVRSWVRADVAELDPVLYRVVSRWLAEAWPFQRVDYAPRP